MHRGAADPWIAPDAETLVAGAEQRRAVTPEDGKSGSTYARVTIGGEPFYLKQVSRSTDWIMRVTGDRDHRAFRIYQAGVMGLAPPTVDHAVVGMALEGTGDDAVLSILMRDVSPWLVPADDSMLSHEQHQRFVEHLADLVDTTWDWHDTLALKTMRERICFFAPATLAPELARADTDPVVGYADQGWQALAVRRPDTHRALTALHADSRALETALAETPQCFVHGDWKLGNLGSHPDGRTVLLDWAYPGRGPVCWDLAWMLALNRSRIPTTKEATIDAFAAALRERGRPTDGWFDRQLDLCLLGMAATMGWEKALGDDVELDWWVDRVRRGRDLLESA